MSIRYLAGRGGSISARTATTEPLLTILVPTYNERDNVEALVGLIEAALAGIAAELVFVDDSDDGTAVVLGGLRSQLPITVVHRQPGERAGGLGTALVTGLRQASGQFICVLDADLQHPPEKVPELLHSALGANADVVVASRYTPGGSAAALPWSRRLVSLGSKWLSKLLFPERLMLTSDPGSGFFLIRREVIEDVQLRPVGYKMLTEVLMRGRWSRIAEVPYRFQSRAAGASKATFRQGAQYLRHNLRLFIEVPDAARLWKFLVVGASGLAVNLGLVWLVSIAAGLPSVMGWATGVETSILTNFWLNRSFTWRDQARPGRGAFGEALRYHATCFVGIAANGATFAAASVAGVPLMLAALLGVAAAVTTNFRGASTWVFRPKSGPATASPRARLAVVATTAKRRRVAAERKAA